ncbi:MAG TPA: deoxyguanosinetriphosphate triphosphohydrolase [Micromonosporaceae bacterium]|jgi:dGTPase
MSDIDEWDAQRYVDEQRKESDGDWRGPFARDRARVLHSAAFRRLAAKTQVHSDPQTGAGFLRTRLTHSLEVAQIAREMGSVLGCDPDVVDTAGLAHDLGHPPFGHNGEQALDEVAAECGGFEGNAQTLRLLSRLEAKIVGPDGASAGLNLTRASLDAACKYPWARRPGERKFGVYADDRPVFDWFRDGVPAPVDQAPRRSIEAQVMDWADDVAYSVHDVEDGIISGHVQLSLAMRDADERAALCRDVAEVYSSLTPDELGEVLAELLAEPALRAVARFDGSASALVALKGLASLLIGRFATAAIRATWQRYGTAPSRRYDADLVVPRTARAQCALLKGIALRYVMRGAGSAVRYEREREVLRELVAALVARGADALDPVFAPLHRQAGDAAAALRVVIDQVASLTDQAALAWHARLRAG